MVTLLQRRSIGADWSLFDQVDGVKTKRANGWQLRTVVTGGSLTGKLKKIGIFLTPSGELWQFDEECPLSAQLTSRRPNPWTEEGALLARCEFVLDNAVEAMADTLDRYGITAAELESLR